MTQANEFDFKKIGRAEDNDIVLRYQQVGRYHAKVAMISDNTFLLEDLDSANGTWVNGLQVKRKLVAADDQVQLADVDFSVKEHFIVQFRSGKIEIEEMVPKGMDPKFFYLKFVWQEYQRLMAELEKNGKIINAIGGGLLLIPGLGAAARVVLSTFLSPQEKLKAMEIEFRRNYVCPNEECGEFLGMDKSWDSLRQKKKCRYCQTYWIKK